MRCYLPDYLEELQFLHQIKDFGHVLYLGKNPISFTNNINFTIFNVCKKVFQDTDDATKVKRLISKGITKRDFRRVQMQNGQAINLLTQIWILARV